MVVVRLLLPDGELVVEPSSISIPAPGGLNEQLQHVAQSCRFTAPSEPELLAAVANNDAVEARAEDDGEVLFTGTIRTDTSWTDNGVPTPVESLSLSIADNTELLNVKAAAEIVLVDTNLAQIVERVCGECAVAIADPDSLPRTTAVKAFVLDEGANLLQALNNVLFQHGFFFGFDEDGAVFVRGINLLQAPPSIADDSVFCAGLKTKRTPTKNDGVKVSFTPLTEKENEQVYFEGNGLNEGNKVTPITVRPGQYYPYDSDPVQEEREGKVWQSFAGGYAEVCTKYNGETAFRRSEKTSLLYTKNHKLVRDWDGELVVDREDFGARRAAVRLLNKGARDANLFQLAIRATACYREAESSVSVGKGGKPYEYAADFIYTASDAEALAGVLSRIFTGANFSISGTTVRPLAPGECYAIDTGASAFIGTAICLSSELDPESMRNSVRLITYGQAAVDVGRHKERAGFGSPTDSVLSGLQDKVNGLLTGEGEGIVGPEPPENIRARAEKESVVVSWDSPAPGITNMISEYRIQLLKGEEAAAEWAATAAESRYPFYRPTDGYPEKEELKKWRLRVKAVNIYGKESEWSGEAYVDVSQYKTWIVPPVRLSSFTAGRDGLTARWSTDPELTYGDIRYGWTLLYDGLAIKERSSLIATYDTYTFDTDTDGYPEKPSVIAQLEAAGLPADGRDVSLYSVEVTACTRQRKDVTESDTMDADCSYYGTWVPANPQSVRAEATENEMKVDVAAPSTPTHYGTPYSYRYQISKDGAVWEDAVEFPGSTWTYAFDREADGYPEKEDLEKWRFRVKAVSTAGKESVAWGGTSTGVPPVVDSYGTWRVQPPVVNTRVADRSVTLLFAQPARADGLFPYGNVLYTVQVQRPDIDSGWHKPATDLDPFADELNYKDGDGAITAERIYTQTMPLAGQSRGDIVDTLYRFKVAARNEAGESGSVVVNATALCTSIRDIVKANETAKKAYISMLSALSANLGNISQGSLTGNDNNKWSLSTFIDDNGIQHYEGEFRAGGRNQYLHIVPILDPLGQVTGEYNIYFKVGNFEISTTASTINGELIVMSSAGSLDRTRITPTGTYYEHRETSASQSWASISQMRTDGIKAQSLYSDKSLVVTNMDIAARRKAKVDIGRPLLSDNSRVWHFDTDLLDQYGREGLEIQSEGKPVLADQYNMAGGSLDFTPAILAVAPYSETGRSLYGQFNATLPMGGTNLFTVDFWVQYIWAENQILFDAGNTNDRIKLVVQDDEVFLNTPLEGEPPLNSEQLASGDVAVLNEPAAACSSIQHYGQATPVPAAEHLRSFDELGIEFKKNTWLHVGLVLTAETMEVFLDHERVVFDRYGSGTEDCDLVLNELMGTFVLDELLVDTTAAEAFEDFSRNTDARIPWGALDKDGRHFVLQADNLVTNIFGTAAFREGVRSVLAESGLV